MKAMAAGLFAGFICLAAATGDAQTNTVHHRFRFYLHPALAAPLTSAELDARLTEYVRDLNTIYSKNTIRRFDFNPATDVTVTDQLDGIHGYHSGDLPEAGSYELWAIAKASQTDYSYGGYMSFATNGAGVAAGMYWLRIHDRNLLMSAPPGDLSLNDYWRQLYTIAHEMAHVFGAGVGEYYSIRNVRDNTATNPVQNIEFLPWDVAHDPYWTEHPDYWTDPLFLWAPDLTLDELLDGMRFAFVSSAVIDAGLRNPFPIRRYSPDLSNITLWVYSDGPDNPIMNATVRVWAVSARTDIAQPIFVGLTDAGGKVPFAWDGQPNNEQNLMLMKVYPPAGLPKVRWYSFYEAQEQKVLFGRDRLNIYVNVAVTNVAPSLSVRHQTDGTIRVSWPARAVDYVLEHAVDVMRPDWRFISQASQTNGILQSVVLPRDSSADFFRLRKP